MRHFFKIFIFSSFFFFFSCEDLDNGLTNGEIVAGLKEALDVGLNNSVTTASSVDGYLKNEIIKILLPPEVKSLQNTIETGKINVIPGVLEVPYSTILDAYIAVNPNISSDPFEELIVAMNRGAEKAADKALPIFGDAIVSMSFDDALGILQGSDTSATHYFYTKTNQALFTAFQPDVKSALDQTKANTIYTSIVGFLNYEYNTGLGTVKVSDFINTSLPETIDGYATEKAIDGLFHLIGNEETKIRQDPYAWGSSIIEKVFGSPEAQG
ncbi:DUF4197 domain-containing protein [Fulvivirga kasyanovii]|uniref:DUF4197 domain-containing protein n=1 Tax=Fulvivirga kasyanovii TaxID=396812 RepID=A0ABW9RU76_9BACT|nr:DUF4197 domain-containing protein [Fulvivirga kasyanovii]MTI27772.1 DUF4197 domain-containing protein [Fulvivirga kasyanovii]